MNSEDKGPRKGAVDLSTAEQDDPRVVAALREYQAALDAGHRPDRDGFLARHPDIAAELDDCLRGLELVHGAAPLLQPSGADIAAAAAQLGADVLGHAPLGDFRLLREVGRGGMGVVYEAEQLSLKRRVALKVLPLAAALEPKHLHRFQREAETAAHLHHTNIVPVYAVGCERGVHYYAMQFIDGQPLSAVIHALRGNDEGRSTNDERPPNHEARMTEPSEARATAETPLGLRHSTFEILSSLGIRHSSFFRNVAQLGVQAAEALGYAHGLGVVHRDIKPANLLLDLRGNLWITDFGLARLPSETALTLSGDLVGTLRYMSPEQATGRHEEVGPRTDLYALGATLYGLLTLRPVFEGRDRQELLRRIEWDEPVSVRRHNPAVPAELETIVHKALAKQPGERYATAQELADDLRRFLEDRPIRAKRPTLWQRLKKWGRRHRTMVRAGVVVLLLAVVGLAVSTVLIWQAKEDLRQALRRERQVAYYHSIALAEREWAANNYSRADQLLDECPPHLRGWEWYYVKGVRRGNSPPLRGHTAAVWSVAFSPDGKHLASASYDRTVKVWNAATGQALHTLQGSDNLFARSVVFSPDGRCVASVGTPSCDVKLWDTVSGQEIRTFSGAKHPIVHVAFSPDGKRLAAAIHMERAVKVWDMASGAELLLEGHSDFVNCVTFSPDGTRLASASHDQTVKLWDATTGRELLTLRGLAFRVMWVTFRPDGQQLAAASGPWFRGDDGEVKIWNATTGQELRTLRGHTGHIFCVAFSPDGRRLATAGYDQTVKIWDAATGEEALTLRGHSDQVFAVAFSPDGHRLASCSADKTIRIWDATPLEGYPDMAVRTLRHHAGRVTSVAFSPDGQRLASASQDKTVRIADPITGQEPLILTGHTDHVNKVVFSPDGRLASAGLDKTIKVWDVTTGRELRTINGRAGVIHHLAYSHDGRRLATAHWQRTAKVWDAATGEEIFKFDGHTGTVTSVAFSPDDRHLASGSMDGTVKVWDLVRGTELRTFGGHDGRIMGVAYSPDGQRLASAATDGTVRIWDAREGHCLWTLNAHAGWAWCVAYSPDGRYLASAGNDAVIRIWDSTTGKELHILRGHTRWVESVAYSPDGKFLASAGWDGTVKIWQAPP